MAAHLLWRSPSPTQLCEGSSEFSTTRVDRTIQFLYHAMENVSYSCTPYWTLMENEMFVSTVELA